MSWHVECIKNTVKIPKKCTQDLISTGHYAFEGREVRDISNENGTLWLNPDHMEDIGSFLWDDEVRKVLNNHKISGDVCFGDVESRSGGSFYGWRFDGKGNSVELTGEIVWKEKS